MGTPLALEQLDYEGDLAIVIGRAASRVKSGEALTYVAGYTIMNDVSCRDIQFDEIEGRHAPVGQECTAQFSTRALARYLGRRHRPT